MRKWIPALALAALLAAGGHATAQDARKALSFGTLDAPNADAVRDQARAWLKAAGKTDAASAAQFDNIWKPADRPVLDRLADTFVLGSADPAKLLADARDADTPAPVEVPALLKDPKSSTFFRAHLALAYAKALTLRRVYE